MNAWYLFGSTRTCSTASRVISILYEPRATSHLWSDFWSWSRTAARRRDEAAIDWHPYAVSPDVDYAAEPTTLVEFRLEEAAGGTLLTMVESGFDRLPSDRRAEAFRMNDRGWAEQTANIARHVAAA